MLKVTDLLTYGTAEEAKEYKDDYTIVTVKKDTFKTADGLAGDITKGKDFKGMIKAVYDLIQREITKPLMIIEGTIAEYFITAINLLIEDISPLAIDFCWKENNPFELELEKFREGYNMAYTIIHPNFGKYDYTTKGQVCYFTTAPPSRFEQVKTPLKNIVGKVDRAILIGNNTGSDIWTPELIAEITALGVEVYIREWNDNFVDMRNFALDKIQWYDWVIWSDSDEWFNEVFLNDIPSIIHESEKNESYAIRINAHDLTTPFNSKEKATELKSSHYKQLAFKKLPGVKWIGVGAEKNVHEHLILPGNTKVSQLDDKYFYVHIKEEWEVWERATRNVKISGGSNNVGGTPKPENFHIFFNPEWLKLQEICKELEIDSWPAFKEYLKLGNIDWALKNWITDNRKKGMDWENEMTDIFKYYFYYLHPSEKPIDMDIINEIAPDSMADYAAFIEEQYIKILGRHAELEGKAHYLKQLMNKEITRQELTRILEESDESNKESNELMPLTGLKIHAPQVEVTEDVILQILQHSKTYNQDYYPKFEVGEKLKVHSAIQWKIETGGRNTDDAPEESFHAYRDTVLKHFTPKTHPNMLDLGAGAGEETKVFMEAGFKVLGLTAGIDNVAHAKEIGLDNVIQQDIHSLPFPKDYFDCAIMIHTFEHLYAPIMFIGELFFCIREGGRVYIAVPDTSEAQRTIWHVNLMEPWQIVHYFNYWGFKLIWQGDWQFVFEKEPISDISNWGYLKHVYELRSKI